MYNNPYVSSLKSDSTAIIKHPRIGVACVVQREGKIYKIIFLESLLYSNPTNAMAGNGLAKISFHIHFFPRFLL